MTGHFHQQENTLLSGVAYNLLPTTTSIYSVIEEVYVDRPLVLRFQVSTVRFTGWRKPYMV